MTKRSKETDIYKYLGMVINKLGDLKDHILELNRKCEVINREIHAIGTKYQVGKEEIRVKFKLYETCLMPALLYGIEAWGKIDKDEINEIDKIQGRALKRIFDMPISTSYIALFFLQLAFLFFLLPALLFPFGFAHVLHIFYFQSYFLCYLFYF